MNRIPMPTRLSIGAVLFHTPEKQLHQFLKSLGLAATDYFNFDLQFVDNSGVIRDSGIEGLVEELDAGEWDLQWHESEGNVGFARAHNRLMASAFTSGADHYFCVNPDGFFHPEAFANLARHLEVCGDGCLIEMRQLPSEHPKPYNAMTLETDWCSAAALLIPRRIYEDIGGFDENMFMYCEDVDLSWRARLAGYTCRMAADAYFYHDVSGRKPSPSRDRELFTSARYLAWKWKNPQFLDVINTAMVNQGLARDARLLPNLEQFEQIQADRDALAPIVEFRRMFHFSEARWSIN